jgi:hypothetical protein
MALISCKCKEQIALKQVIDLRTNMIPTMEQVIKRPVSNHTFQDSKNWQNVQRQVDYIHGDYKCTSNYHNGIGNNISYWDLTLEEWDILHLPK